MRILLSKKSRRELFLFLKEKNKDNSFRELAYSLKIPFNTLQRWMYEEKRYLPEKIIPKDIFPKLEIIDKKEDNWGRIKGGKKTYQIILEKYGQGEIRRRQSNGGRKSTHNLIKKEEELIIDLDDPVFLEFYGILLGDGWLSKLKYKDKIIYLIGISGHISLDREFFIYCKKNISTLFRRKAYLKVRPEHNSMELLFGHKVLLKKLNKNLDFPVGKKVDLKIPKEIFSQGFDKIKYIIRGVFDTDGSFYFDKTPANKPYPCISISMKQPILMKQIYDILINEGFKAHHDKSGSVERIKLKGRIQLDKWMDKIGSSNPKHLNKINALVAQPGFRAIGS